jgi:hypothetical protein
LNFQATYNHPGNAFNLERVTMKTSERLCDYTNQFFENRNTCVGVRDDQVVDSYKKGIKDRKIFEKIHESGTTTVVSLMKVVNKLIDTDEALVNQFDSDAKRDAGTSAAAIDLGSSSASDLQRCSWWTNADLRRSKLMSSMRCSTTPARSMRGPPTPFVSASSSRGRSTRPKTRSDLEVTAISHLHVTTTTTAATIDMAAMKTIVMTTGDVITRSRRTTAMSASYLPHWRHATPTAHSSRLRGRST